MTSNDDSRRRCEWADGSDELMRAYHDEEWGIPLRDERGLFEMLTLEGAQAGLSWSTILKKRQGYREAFLGFDPEKVAAFDSSDIDRLLNNPGIVRNRLKVESTISNARAILGTEEPFAELVWRLAGGTPKRNRWEDLSQLPAETPVSKAMSKALKKHGFRFVGPTVCYAFMQAVGMVDDHIVNCFRHGAGENLSGQVPK